MDKVYHPQNEDQAKVFSKYLSKDGIQMTLSSDSCMCNACYKQCSRNADEDKIPPRWIKCHKKGLYPSQKHCAVCHYDGILFNPGDKTPCKDHDRWGPPDWCHGFSRQFWQKYFTYSRFSDISIRINDSSILCYRHFMETYNKVLAKKCKVCSSKESTSWNMAFADVKKFNSILEKRGLSHVSAVDWICGTCTTNPKNNEGSGKMSSTTVDADQEFIKGKVTDALHTVSTKGYILRQELIHQFNEVQTSYKQTNDINDLTKMFENHLTTYISKSSNIEKYSNSKGISHVGTLYYDTKHVSSTVIASIYEMLYQAKLQAQELKHVEADTIHVSDISSMIESQIDLFSNAGSHFDYRKLFEDNTDGPLLKGLLHEPLVDFVSRITKTGKYGSKSEKESQKSQHKGMLKVQMIIALLCNIMNNSCIFMQKLIGYVLFTGGLRKKATDILNSFGISCSYSTLDNEAKYWSDHRDPLSELDKTKTWRLSFDNLNFKRKFAKTVQFGGDMGGRMLNLITSQVTHNSENVTVNQPVTQVPRKETLAEQDFFYQPESQEYVIWTQFLKEVSDVVVTRFKNIDKLSSTFLKDLESRLPTYTPTSPDNVVYTRIEASQASSVEDVSKFLTNLKSDLKIGEPDYPEKCIVCGDQQTYVIVQNLIRKYPDDFCWILPIPGHWHLLKLAAETIRDLLWDGGLHDLAKECGHHKDLVQWKDVHRMLLGVHEALSLKLTEQWMHLKKESDESLE